MDVALYWTVWISLALFTAGEVLRALARHGRDTGAAGWSASAAGVIVMIVHIAIAMSIRHGWSHDAAIAATAQQTRSVYGLDWGGGYFANYLFLAAWIGDLIVWRREPAPNPASSAWGLWVLRGFYFVMIANAAIVFAAGARRFAGVIVVLVLVAAWSSTRQPAKLGA